MKGRAITRSSLTVLVMTSGAFAGAQAAANSLSQPTMTRHQLVTKTIDCMKKLMSADRGISYNGAARICRHQITAQSDKSPAGALVASGSSTNP